MIFGVRGRRARQQFFFGGQLVDSLFSEKKVRSDSRLIWQLLMNLHKKVQSLRGEIIKGLNQTKV